MAEDKNYGWIRFYTELADKLLEYRSNRTPLVEKLKQVFNNAEIPLPKLDDDGHFTDIDPFTFIGLFNKKLTEENRRKIIEEMGRMFAIEPMAADEGFNGVPLLNNLKATFYTFASERKPADIDNLWDLFASALTYAAAPDDQDKQENFYAKYDAVKAQKGIKWNITMGLFWIRPYSFISLDDKNRVFFRKPDHLAKVEQEKMGNFKSTPDGKHYLQFCRKLLSDFQDGTSPFKTFPALSQQAWLESQNEPEEEDYDEQFDHRNTTMPKITHEQLVSDLKELLLTKKQIVLTGAPGTGKTFLAKEIAASMLGKTVKEMLTDAKAGTEKRFRFRQFHPGYDYSDFVEGLKPYLSKDGKPTFVPTAGTFMQFCIDAADDTSEPKSAYVMVIDEINRADLSRVFGELFYGLEKDYRGEPVPTQYNYLENRIYLKGKPFVIPDNVYIIGTMNDIDRSVESMDFALRRRFAWQEITVEDSECIIEKNVPEAISPQVIKAMHDINEKIIKDRLQLENAYYLGGAYFRDVQATSEEDWRKLWKNNIKVILTEYLRTSRKNLKIEDLEHEYYQQVLKTGE